MGFSFPTLKRAITGVAVGAASSVVLLVSHPAAAADQCATLFPSNVVYVYGSTAIRPVIANLAYAFAVAGDPLKIVFGSNGGSCSGVGSVLQTPLMGAGGEYWPADPVYDPNGPSQSTMNPPTCTIPDQRADVAVSDVFPTSCPQIDSSLLTGFYDFNPGFAQAAEFIVSNEDTQSPAAISEEAAYLTFGFGADSTTEWSDPSRIFIRDEASGTMQMIARAIGVPANRFIKAPSNANVELGTGQMLTAVSGAVGSIGYAFATDLEKAGNPPVRALAYQAMGQQCAYFPNSSLSSHDKANVRDGHYPIWGRFHIVAPVDAQNKPTNPAVARLLNIINGVETVPGVNVLDILINNNTIPLCAMNVTRDREIGPMSSYQPEKSCGCYFDSKRGTLSADCKTCSNDMDCTTDRPKCNHWGLTNDGYCEVQ